MPWNIRAGWFAIAVALCSQLVVSASSPTKSTAALKVGVYDSRVLAYAHFWSDPARQHRDALAAAATAAKQSGDAKRYAELRSEQDTLRRNSHLQTFSTAPAAEALAALAPRLPQLKQELGVDRFVSRWDGRTLAHVPEPDRIDVTDRLARELLPDPTPRQQRQIASMKEKEPIPLWKMKIVLALGE